MVKIGKKLKITLLLGVEPRSDLMLRSISSESPKTLMIKKSSLPKNKINHKVLLIKA